MEISAYRILTTCIWGICLIAIATQISGCKTTQNEPSTTMVSPLMEISGGQTSEKAMATASVTKPSIGAESNEQDEDTFILEFTKGKFSISHAQNVELRAFVTDARARNKKFQIISYAQPQPAGTSSDVYAKTMLDANRRGQATGMILRLHGVTPHNMKINTKQTGLPGKRQVKLMLI